MIFKKVLPPGRMPRIVACGSRRDAYERFCTALTQYPDTFCVLLVDSEAPVDSGKSSWDHLRDRSEDNWNKPENADNEHAHLMVQCMEAWFLADKPCLAAYFGQGFNENALPKNPNVEQISKKDIFDGLKSATRNTKTKGKYGKGSHSFEILSRIDPERVKKASYHVQKLVDTMIQKALA